ncbi:uncharacterized protein LDX57_007809 [Aspergillus melleus]|uniref:uncharacterized protein n=1 Tax=Aspergillus melleus TaxID=138277 RepID=UPI001E8E6BB5|nr:uncharacterized protein LDX57_007809 [Aspergillus melleus]KAH8430139.1 hypothetical protein LDX57_007809 [Aspergillus melleus]
MASTKTDSDISDTFKVLQHTVPSQHIREYPQATAVNQEDEAYEPFWVDIYQAANKSGLAIRGIWMADVAHQGVSGLVNEERLGNDPSAFDHSRDLLLLINRFRDSLPQPIFGLGHSMGATQLIHLSLMHPRILQGSFLIEPIVFPYSGADQGRYPAALVSLRRRDTFPTKDMAVAHFQRSRLFQSWDPRAFDKWIEYGLRDAPPGSEPRVVLTTPKSQELSTFVRPILAPKSTIDRRMLCPDLALEALDDERILFYRPEPVITFHNLPHLRPPTMYAFCEGSQLVTREMRTVITEKTGTGVGGSGGVVTGRVNMTVINDAGHFAPMEHPQRLADHVVEWLQGEDRRWIAAGELERPKHRGQDEGSPREMSREVLALLGGTDSCPDTAARPHKL